MKKLLKKLKLKAKAFADKLASLLTVERALLIFILVRQEQLWANFSLAFEDFLTAYYTNLVIMDAKMMQMIIAFADYFQPLLDLFTKGQGT